MKIYDKEKEDRAEAKRTTFRKVPDGALFSHGGRVRIKLKYPYYRIAFEENRPCLQEVNAMQIGQFNGKPAGEGSVFSPDTEVFEHPKAALYLKG